MVWIEWAQAANGVIGRHGALPWHLPEEMRHFRELTMGATVVMGRATWESLPAKFRPLPARRNLVLSRQAGYAAPGAVVVPSLTAAIEAAGGEPTWVIGGAQVYRDALPYADRAVVTELEQDFDGDVWAPVLDASWSVSRRTPLSGWSESASGLRFRVIEYHRAIALQA
jgi:dihydrofolate reductase